ncbi:MAG: NAD-dependent epimerase/dehydratase family protein [Patescibacteria group bacterium]
MMPIAWIVGQGGLLGGSLARACEESGVALWKSPAFPWNERAALQRACTNAVRAFAGQIQKGQPWIVLWAAGIGTVGSAESALAEETHAWEMLLQIASEYLLPAHPCGTLFFSSSAGAIYSGVGSALITEDTPPHPLSAYGRTKIAQEKLLTSWAEQHPSISCVTGRISNLYGERQNLAKHQGVISHCSGRILRRAPIHVYVPLDTIRDYVYSEDCARAILALLLATQRASHPRRILKIFASERTTTLAEILGIFTRIAKTPPHIVCGRAENAKEHPRCVRFHSTVAKELLPLLRRTSLLEGIHRLHEHQRRLFEQGALHPVPLRGSALQRSV